MLDGKIGIFDSGHPAYTIFHKNTETYATLWIEYNADFTTFYDNCTSDIDTYKDERTLDEYLFAKPNAPANIFVSTAIPWAAFTGFSHRMDNGSKYLAPMVTIGKYFEQQENTRLPLAVHVNHAVCDGFHVARFLNELQSMVDSLECTFNRNS
jgi:chloramphenicol O-acetyltransferase type A